MEKSLKCHLATAIVNKAIHNLKSDPERTVRNLIDMAIQITDSPFQQEFYSIAQRLLSNENSGYYALVKDTIALVNEETVLTFCMNLGFHGLYEGSAKIRNAEKAGGYTIPWAVSMLISDRGLFDAHYDTIEQGERMGIHCWYLFSDHSVYECIALAEDHPTSAFVIFCDSNEMDQDALACAKHVQNIAIMIPFDENAGMVCDLLRFSGILYGL